MIFLHVSDLHIGKRLHECSFLEDQEYILNQILEIARTYEVDGILIAGDIYDKSVPLERGVSLFDDFLTKCCEQKHKVFMISGNHDSSQRIHFGGRIMEQSGVYIQGTYEGHMKCTTLEDEYGKVNVYLLPFIKPAIVRPYFGEVESYEEAVKKVLESQKLLPGRNILVAHQYVTGSGDRVRCDSESINVGGVDNVDASIFSEFDYVALGHLHMAQKVGSEKIYYSGSPLKYSFSEAEIKGDKLPVKSVMLIRMEDNISYENIPLTPMRDMRVIRGRCADLIDPENYQKANTDDYIRAILTDEEELYDPLRMLRQVYPNVLRLDFDNTRSRLAEDVTLAAEDVKEMSMLELFDEFYEKQNNEPLTEEQKKLLAKEGC